MTFVPRIPLIALLLCGTVSCLDDTHLHPLPEFGLEGVDLTARRVEASSPSPAEPPAEPQEVCNGEDDDGDGEIDEDLEPEPYWPSDAPPACFGGSSECSVGILVCEAGDTRLYDLVVPEDGDCDCDGIPDSSGQRIALVVDNSGSMDQYQRAVEAALCRAEQQSPHDHALVVFGGAPSSETGPETIVAGWGEDGWGCRILPYMGGSNEFQTDALRVLLERHPWPEVGVRRVVIVADETPQGSSASDPRGLGELTERCLSDGFEVTVLTSDFRTSEWWPLVETCGGYVAELTQNADDLAPALMGL